MIRRATWIAAGGVLLALVLAVVAYGWWHQQHDAARDKTLREANDAAVVAKAARDEALRRSAKADSLVVLQRFQLDFASERAAALRKRLDSLERLQPSGTFGGVPHAEEPEGTTWRGLYFVADSALIQERAARAAAENTAKLYLDDRNRWIAVSNAQDTAIQRLNTAVAVALTQHDCHLLWVIACPSRKASVVLGVAVGVGTVLVLQKRGFP